MPQLRDDIMALRQQWDPKHHFKAQTAVEVLTNCRTVPERANQNGLQSKKLRGQRKPTADGLHRSLPDFSTRKGRFGSWNKRAAVLLEASRDV